MMSVDGELCTTETMRVEESRHLSKCGNLRGTIFYNCHHLLELVSTPLYATLMGQC